MSEDDTQIEDTIPSEDETLDLVRRTFSFDHPAAPDTFAQLSSFGFTKPDICLILGITQNELDENFKARPLLEASYIAGPKIANAKVVAKLYENAVEKGNVAAQQFWLKNREKEKWSDNLTVTNVRVDLKEILAEARSRALVDMGEAIEESDV